MSPSEFDKPQSRRSELIWTVSQLIFAASSLAAVLLASSDRFVFNSTTAEILGIAFLALLYLGGTLLLIRRLRRVRNYKFRLAITGRPSAGKTVFSVLVFDALMNERVPGLEFTASSRSVISVYQAIRNIPANIWPKSTSKGSVSAYEGTIEARRLRVDLEIGDTAGEYWLELPDEADRDAGYLEYVLSSHATAHVIPLDGCIAADGVDHLAREIEDLRLVSRLKRQIDKVGGAGPLLIILSKADLVLPMRMLTSGDVGLFRVVDRQALAYLPLVEHIDAGNFPGAADDHRLRRSLFERPLRERLSLMAEQLAPEFSSVRFLFSSAPAATANRLSPSAQGHDLTVWTIDEALEAQRRGHRRGILTSFMFR